MSAQFPPAPTLVYLTVTLSDMQNKSVLSLALATAYRPPGPYTDFLKELADFLSDLLVNVDEALIVADFNIHVDNTNDAFISKVFHRGQASRSSEKHGQASRD